MRQVLMFLWCAVSVSAFCQDRCRNVYTERTWNDRDKWQRADDILKKLQLTDKSRVADIGSHEGYMTMKLARLAPEGIVYAVDLDSSRLNKLRAHARSRDLSNIETIQSIPDDPKLPDRLDAVLIVDAYHEMKAHDAILRSILAALNPGGRLVLCEPIAEIRRNSSRKDQQNLHELGMEYAVADLKRAGFMITFQQDRFIDREKIKEDKMWLIVAVKP